MKHLRLTIILVSVLSVFASCEKSVQPSTDEPLTLKLSTDSVLCLPIYKDLPALELAWTAGTNHGTGSAISYSIDMDIEGNNFSGGLSWEIGRTADRTLVFGHKQLADTLALTFPEIAEGQYTRFEWRVKAIVLDTKEQQVSKTVSVALAWRASMLTDLYLIGDATPSGWNRERATPMVIDMNNFSSFSWTGQMHKGEFKMLTTTEDWIPSYVRDTLDAGKIVYRPTEDAYPDKKWNITQAGNYRIEVDVQALTINITYIGGEVYSHIYMIGDATPGGWSWDNITELNHPETNIFTYEGNLGSGQLKFPTELKSDWSGEMLYALTPDCAPTASGKFDAHTGDPDNKWLISDPGEYQIRINIKDTTISFVKL